MRILRYQHRSFWLP